MSAIKLPKFGLAVWEPCFEGWQLMRDGQMLGRVYAGSLGWTAVYDRTYAPGFDTAIQAAKYLIGRLRKVKS